MRSAFTPAQLRDPDLVAAERPVRACVHCGICTATCPTYVLLGDERDGPRGRIVMMQRMLETGGTPSEDTVRHVDRCLSCLGCRTACPSNVDYARLVDAARAHIQTHYRRPWRDAMLRSAIALVLPNPVLVKLGVGLARVFSPVATRLPGTIGDLARKAIVQPRTAAATPQAPDRAAAVRVALMPGCVQQALAPTIDAAARRVLARRGIAAETLSGAGCCGALSHHLGRRADARAFAKRAIVAFEQAGALDAVSITATGCAAHLADYPHLFAGDAVWQPRAEAFAAKMRDYSELALARPLAAPAHLRVAHHIPCSLQHGLRRADHGEAALEAAGFDVVAIGEAHLCCGSAGSYSLLQPGIAQALRDRKLGNIAKTGADVVASANIGCLSHLSGPDALPVVHPAELIDWAEGGPRPAALADIAVAGSERV